MVERFLCREEESSNFNSCQDESSLVLLASPNCVYLDDRIQDSKHMQKPLGSMKVHDKTNNQYHKPNWHLEPTAAGNGEATKTYVYFLVLDGLGSCI